MHIREHLHSKLNALIKPCTKGTDGVTEEMNQLVQKKNDAKLAKRKAEVLDKATSSKVSKVQWYPAVITLNV